MRQLLTVIVPAYNEQEVLLEFHGRMSAVCDQLASHFDTELLYVNDGSSDRTQELINQLCQQDARVSAIELSRNFGKEAAMTAGFDHAKGDAVVIIDADLQDPPELIVEMVHHWQAGYDVVYAQRTVRDGESWLKKTTASAFYRLIGRIAKVNIPKDTGDFRLMSRRAVDSLNLLREQHRFMKGLFAFVGYPQKALLYHRDARAAGESKFNFWKLWNFALEGITSFTIAPLKMASYIGVTTAVAAFVYGLYVVLKTLIVGETVPGYPSLMVAILFMGGVQLLFIGILGEYMGRVYNETKARPLYFIHQYHLAETARQVGARNVD